VKKVVRIIGRMNGGGPARQVAYLHRSLRSSFETILVIGAVEPGEYDMRYLLEDSIGVVEIPSMSRSVKVWSDLVSLITITRLLLRERPDIVHTHTAKAGVLGRVAALLAGVPVRIHTYHGNVFQGYFGKRTSRLIIAIERMLNRVTTRVIAISESQAEELVGRFRVADRRKVAIIRNGFDLSAMTVSERQRVEVRQTLGIASDDLLVVWAGRIAPIKNLPLLLEVANRASHLPKIKFLVAGDGGNREVVVNAAQASSNLIFIGWQKDMSPIWAASDIALLTSKNEGTPTSLIEAMVAGKPFVATSVGGVLDLAKSPVKEISADCTQAANGFLTAAAPEVIVACIEKLSSSPGLAKEMGDEGRSFALANYSQERLSCEVLSLYRELEKLRKTDWGDETLPNTIAPSLRNDRVGDNQVVCQK